MNQQIVDEIRKKIKNDKWDWFKIVSYFCDVVADENFLLALFKGEPLQNEIILEKKDEKLDHFIENIIENDEIHQNHEKPETENRKHNFFEKELELMNEKESKKYKDRKDRTRNDFQSSQILDLSPFKKTIGKDFKGKIIHFKKLNNHVYIIDPKHNLNLNIFYNGENNQKDTIKIQVEKVEIKTIPQNEIDKYKLKESSRIHICCGTLK